MLTFNKQLTFLKLSEHFLKKNTGFLSFYFCVENYIGMGVLRCFRHASQPTSDSPAAVETEHSFKTF